MRISYRLRRVRGRHLYPSLWQVLPSRCSALQLLKHGILQGTVSGCAAEFHAAVALARLQTSPAEHLPLCRIGSGHSGMAPHLHVLGPQKNINLYYESEDPEISASRLISERLYCQTTEGCKVSRLYLTCSRVSNARQADISKGCKDMHQVHLKQLADPLVHKRSWLETPVRASHICLQAKAEQTLSLDCEARPYIRAAINEFSHFRCCQG